MTNYEKIKAMNLTSLAILLSDIQTDAILAHPNYSEKFPSTIIGFCEWLESEVEEDG